MKIFITGGTGFIGSQLIEYFLDQKNAEIYTLIRNRKNLKWLESLDLHILEGDLFSIPPLPSDIDFVFHIAGITKANNSAYYYTVNQHGTASLLQALQTQKINLKKLVLLSSQAVCGPSSDGQPISENSPPAPITHYGKSKLEAENEALKFKEHFPLTILRAPTIFGPRDPVLLPYFKFIKKGLLPSLGKVQRLVSLCYVKDLIKAFDLSTKTSLKSGEIFNVADPTPRSWNELGQAAGKALDVKLKTIKLPLGTLYPFYFISELLGKIRNNPSILSREKYFEMKQSSWIVNTEAAQEKLGFTPLLPFQEAIQETIDWYIDNKWL
ncbi:MAG: NAD(P)-dependent oxidoreductase [Candidatus Aminicenantes bacterium]|nr:NAD(P)-dependent oxidoreductase [Candidatus Aminicenantes bacterium]